MKLSLIATLLIMSNTLLGQQKEPSNKHFWHSLPTTADRNAVWQTWTDVPNWKTWDTGLQDATINGAFTLGAKGTILSLEGRTSKFEVVAIDPGISYTIKTRLPLGSLYVKRYMTDDELGLTFTHEVWFAGLTKGIFAKAFGANFRVLLPEVMQNVKRIAEAQTKEQ